MGRNSYYTYNLIAVILEDLQVKVMNAHESLEKHIKRYAMLWK